jgi:hypothetical protein
MAYPNWLQRQMLRWALPATREPSERVLSVIMAAIRVRALGGGMATRSQALAAWQAGVDMWLIELRHGIDPGVVAAAAVVKATPLPDPKEPDDPTHPDEEEEDA